MKNEQVKKDSQLQVLVKESGLEETKSKVILDKFQNTFELAAEWEIKAKAIVVTDASQTGDMKMAREGRLFLKKIRVEAENTRKELKQQSLLEGKAIDGIANVIKALIVPIEDHLDKQEHFVEIKQKQEEDEHRREVERRMEQERIEKEEADRKAEARRQEEQRLENIRLREESEAKEKQLGEECAAREKERKATEKRQREFEEQNRAERYQAEQKRQAEIKKADEDAAEEKRIADEKLEAAQKKIDDDAAKAEKERDAQAVKDAAGLKKQREFKEKLESERKERERLEAELVQQIVCPNCHHKFNLE